MLAGRIKKALTIQACRCDPPKLCSVTVKMKDSEEVAKHLEGSMSFKIEAAIADAIVIGATQQSL